MINVEILSSLVSIVSPSFCSLSPLIVSLSLARAVSAHVSTFSVSACVCECV